MKSLCFLFFNLMLMTLTTNGQTNKPDGRAIQPVSAPERHRNPDFQEPDSQLAKERLGRKRLFRRESTDQSDVQALPFSSFGAENMLRYPPKGVQFGVSPDGRWLFVKPNYSDIHSGEPWRRQEPDNPAGGSPTRMNRSFSAIRP